MADGRFGLRVATTCIACDPFGQTPLVTLEDSAPLEVEAGWPRTMSDALVGLRIEAVRARPGDRLVALDCSAQSRFGVRAGYRFVVELVPRFGNIVLLKDDTVVAAAKEFPRSAAGRRATVVGEAYEPPPLPRPSGHGGASATATDGVVQAVRAAVPLLPQLLATSIVVGHQRRAADETSDESGPVDFERCLTDARTLVAEIEHGAYDSGAVFAYRDRRRLVQCHIVPLAQYAHLIDSPEAELLPLLREHFAGATAEGYRAAFEARRASLRKRLERRRAELADAAHNARA